MFAAVKETGALASENFEFYSCFVSSPHQTFWSFMRHQSHEEVYCGQQIEDHEGTKTSQSSSTKTVLK